MLIEIKSRRDGRVLFSGEFASVHDAVIAAGNARADLVGADLGGADLVGADLVGADLGGADLGGADLRGADLGGAYLRGADLGGADLRGADLRGADLGDTKIKGRDAVVQIGPIGSRADTLIVFRTEDGYRVQTGCFYGKPDDFLARVMDTHGTNKHATNYRNALELAVSMLDGE